MIFFSISALFFIMAAVTILLVKNWKKSVPVLKKIALLCCVIGAILIGLIVSFALIKENWSSISEFCAENFVKILSWTSRTIAFISFIASYVCLYALFNDYAPPADNAEDDGTRTAAIGWAAVIGGTLNFALIGLLAEMGPLSSTYEALNRYSREAGLKVSLSFAVIAALSCWSLPLLIYRRVRRSKAARSSKAEVSSE